MTMLISLPLVLSYACGLVSVRGERTRPGFNFNSAWRSGLVLPLTSGTNRPTVTIS